MADDPKDWTAAQIMAAMSLAIRAGDMPSVSALLHMLALKDPASAQLLMDTIKLGTGRDGGS